MFKRDAPYKMRETPYLYPVMKFSINKETQKIIRAAKDASSKAAREARALGLTVRIIEKGIIYDVDADGHKVQVGMVPQLAPTAGTIKKGTVLHLGR